MVHTFSIGTSKRMIRFMNSLRNNFTIEIFGLHLLFKFSHLWRIKLFNKLSLFFLLTYYVIEMLLIYLSVPSVSSFLIIWSFMIFYDLGFFSFKYNIKEVKEESAAATFLLRFFSVLEIFISYIRYLHRNRFIYE